jgi:hypothetical protein
MSGFSISDQVRLVIPTERHEWTEHLVGHVGEVEEVTEKAVAVAGLIPEDVLWFSKQQLEEVKES